MCSKHVKLSNFLAVRTGSDIFKFLRTLNRTVGSVRAFSLNHEPNFRFSSGWFGFEPKFRTELFHHYA
jgi:hypothetical protein